MSSARQDAIRDRIEAELVDPLQQMGLDVEAVLDADDVMGQQPYTLEVTSRGVDRPLTLPRHWRRNVDRLVKVTTTGGEVLTGRILENDDESAEIDVDGSRRRLAFADVAKALVQIEFNRRGATSTAKEA